MRVFRRTRSRKSVLKQICPAWTHWRTRLFMTMWQLLRAQSWTQLLKCLDLSNRFVFDRHSHAEQFQWRSWGSSNAVLSACWHLGFSRVSRWTYTRNDVFVEALRSKHSACLREADTACFLPGALHVGSTPCLLPALVASKSYVEISLRGFLCVLGSRPCNQDATTDNERYGGYFQKC